MVIGSGSRLWASSATVHRTPDPEKVVELTGSVPSRRETKTSRHYAEREHASRSR